MAGAPKKGAKPSAAVNVAGSIPTPKAASPGKPSSPPPSKGAPAATETAKAKVGGKAPKKK